jgi:hypothetical protein
LKSLTSLTSDTKDKFLKIRWKSSLTINLIMSQEDGKGTGEADEGEGEEEEGMGKEEEVTEEVKGEEEEVDEGEVDLEEDEEKQKAEAILGNIISHSMLSKKTATITKTTAFKVSPTTPMTHHIKENSRTKTMTKVMSIQNFNQAEAEPGALQGFHDPPRICYVEILRI